MSNQTAEVVLASERKKALERVDFKARNELFSSREKLHEETMNSMRQIYVVREEMIADRLCHEVLEERLAALPWPEFRLLAAHHCGFESAAIEFWKKAVEEER